MAYVSQSLAQVTLADRLAGFFAPLRTALAQHAEYQRVSEELNALTDYELADIAITRGDIKAIAKEAALAL
jgi:uncharacterized protein YjiS (DUF1127 family)